MNKDTVDAVVNVMTPKVSATDKHEYNLFRLFIVGFVTLVAVLFAGFSGYHAMDKNEPSCPDGQALVHLSEDASCVPFTISVTPPNN